MNEVDIHWLGGDYARPPSNFVPFPNFGLWATHAQTASQSYMQQSPALLPLHVLHGARGACVPPSNRVENPVFLSVTGATTDGGRFVPQAPPASLKSEGSPAALKCEGSPAAAENGQAPDGAWCV